MKKKIGYNCFESPNIDLNQRINSNHQQIIDHERLQIDHVVTLSQSLSKLEMFTT